MASASVDLLQDLSRLAAIMALSPLIFSLALASTARNATANSSSPLSTVAKTPRGQSSSRILISGAGAPTALALARLLKNHGHTIIMVDYESTPLVSPARFSKACTKFYCLSSPRTLDRKTISKAVKFNRFGSLTHPCVQTAMKGPSLEELYAVDISAVMQHENIDLWIPCERPCREGPVTYKSFSRAKDAVEAAGRRCICPNDDTAALSRSFVAFAEFINALQLPVRAPVAIVMHSRDDVHRALAQMPPAMAFSLEKIARSVEVLRTPTNSDLVLTDSRGAQSPLHRRSSTDSNPEIVKLSMRNKNSTFNSVAKILISEQTPWLLREDVAGPRLTGSALIVDGRVRAFVACASPETDPLNTSLHEQSWTIIPPSAPLYPALLQFTQQFASYQATLGALHLNITFAASTTSGESGLHTEITPLACNTNIHESMALLMRDPATGDALASVYTSLAAASTKTKHAEGTLVNGIDVAGTVTSREGAISGLHKGFAALLSAVLFAFLLFLRRSYASADVAHTAVEALSLGLTRGDELFDAADPWPWWYANSVCEPVRITGSLARRGYGTLRRRTGGRL